MRVNMYSLCHVCKTEKVVAVYEIDDHMDRYIFIVIQAKILSLEVLKK